MEYELQIAAPQQKIVLLLLIYCVINYQAHFIL